MYASSLFRPTWPLANSPVQTNPARTPKYKATKSNLNRSQALEAIEEEIQPNPELEYLVEFIKRIHDGSSGRQDDNPRR